jgi:hypothetical protein
VEHRLLNGFGSFLSRNIIYPPGLESQAVAFLVSALNKNYLINNRKSTKAY